MTMKSTQVGRPDRCIEGSMPLAASEVAASTDLNATTIPPSSTTPSTLLPAFAGDSSSSKKSTKSSPPTVTVGDNNSTAALAQAGRRETCMVHWLHCVVLTLLLLTMFLISGGVFVYTRNHETQRFETVFGDSAFQVMDSFHDTLEQSLLSLDSFSVTITSLANATNQSFPFVTIPDFEVRGANTRVQSGSQILYYFPLVTDENREAWEDYSMQHRSQVDVAFARDTYMRQQQDAAFGIKPTPMNNNNNNTNTNSTQGSNSSNANTTESEQPAMTILEDGTGYHPHIWSNGAVDPLGDVPQGQGPYLPGWQRR